MQTETSQLVPKVFDLELLDCVTKEKNVENSQKGFRRNQEMSETSLKASKRHCESLFAFVWAENLNDNSCGVRLISDLIIKN